MNREDVHSTFFGRASGLDADAWGIDNRPAEKHPDWVNW
jgi:hypothetical protein